MTDNDLLARTDAWLDGGAWDNGRELARLLADELRARDTELAAARTVTAKLLDGWVTYEDAPGPRWHSIRRNHVQIGELLTDAERAWLTSVSPTVSGEGPVTHRNDRYYCTAYGDPADDCVCGAMDALAAAEDATWD